MRHMSLQQRGNPMVALALILCLSPLLLVEVRAVPASVLAQNSELSTSASNKLQLQQEHQQQQQLQEHHQQQQQQPAAAAKRSEEATAVPTADKKSSPEIVPASFTNPPASRSSSPAVVNLQPPSGVYALPSNDEILAAVAAAAQNSQQQYQEEPTALEEAVASSTMHKRGINYEYNPYLAPSDYGSDVPQGVWSDDYEASIPVNYGERDLQEIDDYVPDRRVSGSSARNKAYDNLQNLLNAEAYLESIPLSVPLTYANRNYNLDDRNKRGLFYNLASPNSNSPSSGSPYNSENINLSKYRRFNDMRLKRDTTKLNPADMLALVALVEAGERARKESDVESSGPVPMISSDDLDYVAPGSWMDVPVQAQAQPGLVDYYGLPLEAQSQVMPKYEYVPRQHKYNGLNSRFGSSKQRYMVAKKKRSVSQSQFMNEPVAERGSSYNGEKYF